MALVFTAGGSAATTGSVTNIGTATIIYGKSSISAATINNVTGAHNIVVVAADDNSANSKFQVAIVFINGTNFEVAIAGSNGGGFSPTVSITYASLPASGDVIVAYFWETFNSGIALFTQSGTLLGSATHNSGVALLTSSSLGFVRINTPPIVHGLNGASYAGQWNGAGIYSGTPFDTTFTSSSWWSAPATGDSGLVFLSEMNDAASGTTPTSAAAQAGGQPLVLTAGNYAWGQDSGGWFTSPASDIVPSPSVASPALVASAASSPTDTTGFIAVSSDPTFATGNAPITSVTQIPVVTSANPTLYLSGVSSATAVGTIGIQIVAGGSALAVVQGVSSQTAVGVVNVLTVIPVLPPASLTLQYIVDMATQFSTANQGLAVLSNVPQMIERIRSDQRAIYTKLGATNRKRFLSVQSVTSNVAASGRAISLTGLVPAAERVLQLVLNDGRTVSIVDLLDTEAELAPRGFVFGPQIVEVGNDWSPLTQAVSGTLYYTQQPTDLDPNGDLTQAISIPGDWADLLIIPLAQFLAAQDTAPVAGGGTPRSDEIQVLQSLYDSRLQAFFSYSAHYAGTIMQRFDIPRPMSQTR